MNQITIYHVDSYRKQGKSLIVQFFFWGIGIIEENKSCCGYKNKGKGEGKKKFV
jgi:hypothetical protein